jgi:hypothetical protein
LCDLTPSRLGKTPEVADAGRRILSRAGGDQEGQKAAGTVLGSKFEESVELSYWSS